MFKKVLLAVCAGWIISSPVHAWPVTDSAQTSVITNILTTMTLQLMKMREILGQEQLQVSAIGKSDEGIVSSAQKIYEQQDKRPDIAQLTFPSTSGDLQSAIGGKDTKLSVQRVLKESYIEPETEELSKEETDDKKAERAKKLQALYINSVASSYASSVAYLSEAERTRANEYDPLKVLASSSGKTLKGKSDARAAISVSEVREIREGNKLLAEFIRFSALKAAIEMSGR